jgi:hypothetical protein
MRAQQSLWTAHQGWTGSSGAIVLGCRTGETGFYSYGEVSLHAATITVFGERARA